MSRFFISLLWLALLAPATVLAQVPPQRIVSMNVCTDQLLLLLVDKARIASLSQFAVDPTYSSLTAEAAGITLNRGQAEQVLALQPDLVLTSMFSATFAASVLQRLHQRVERLGFATSRAEVDAQIATLGEWTGTREKAALLITALHQRVDAHIAALQPRLQGKKAVFLGSNGVAFGRGTLQDEFLQSVGLRNIAGEAGLTGPSKLRLELLVAAQPDFIISEPRGDLDREQAHPLLLHPALQHLHPQQLMLADRWFDCAGPWLADAYAAFAAQVMTP